MNSNGKTNMDERECNNDNGNGNRFDHEAISAEDWNAACTLHEFKRRTDVYKVKTVQANKGHGDATCAWQSSQSRENCFFSSIMELLHIFFDNPAMLTDTPFVETCWNGVLGLARFAFPSIQALHRTFPLSIATWAAYVAGYVEPFARAGKGKNVNIHVDYVHCIVWHGDVYIALPSVMRIVKFIASARGYTLIDKELRCVVYSALRPLKNKGGHMLLSSQSKLLLLLHYHGCLDMFRSQAIYQVRFVNFDDLANKVIERKKALVVRQA